MSKGVLRMAGNVIGAAFGFLVMAAPAVAGSPWGLAALLAAWSAGCGSLVHSRAKYAAYLALYTVSVIILAQVGGRRTSLLQALRVLEQLACATMQSPLLSPSATHCSDPFRGVWIEALEM